VRRLRRDNDWFQEFRQIRFAVSAEADSDANAGLRAAAREQHRRGRFLEAVRTQIELVNNLQRAGQANHQDKKLLCLYLYSLGDNASAVLVLRDLAGHMPDDPDVYENLGVVLLRSGKPREALAELRRALAMRPESTNVHDALARAYGILGGMDQCRKHGETALRLKDEGAARAGPAYPIPDQAPAPFAFDEPQKNIVAFSLFGDKQRYLQGALRNAALIPDIYPGWQCRFYCDDTVPPRLREQLRQSNAEIVMMPRPESFYRGLFWRFLVAGEAQVSRFLVRDCDSVVNVKERVAVDEWLASDRYFHVMRDYYTHTEVMHAGLWGGVGGVFPPLNALLDSFLSSALLTNTVDQVFLREHVWPSVRESCLVHDSCFRVLGAREFPRYGVLAPGRHVGDDESVLRPAAS